jgi:hypothetical protein
MKLQFAWRANSKLTKENCLGFRFLFSVWNAAYIYRFINGKSNERKIATSIYLLQKDKGKGKLPFVCCRRKRKT